MKKSMVSGSDFPLDQSNDGDMQYHTVDGRNLAPLFLGVQGCKLLDPKLTRKKALLPQ